MATSFSQPIHGNYHGYVSHTQSNPAYLSWTCQVLLETTFEQRPTALAHTACAVPRSARTRCRVQRRLGHLPDRCVSPSICTAHRVLTSSRVSHAKLAQTLGARRVVGVDIDDTLVRAAWKRRRTVWSLQKPDAPDRSVDRDGDEDDDATIGEKRKRSERKQHATASKASITDDYFPASCEHMFGPLPLPSSESSPDTFPHNVVFRTADWVNKEIIEDAEGYDIVLA